MRCPTPFLALLMGAAATVVAQEPATQAPVNHSFVAFTIPEKDLYVANAQFESFDEDGNLWPMERLYEVVVLRAPLRP